MAKGQTQNPAKLTSDDFVVEGVSEQMDAVAVRKTLGNPVSIATTKNPFDSGSKITSWRYEGLTLSFIGKLVNAFTLTSASRATKRGLRVGDTAEKIVRLYGEPQLKFQGDWQYVDPKLESHVLRMTVKKGRITSITVGMILD